MRIHGEFGISEGNHGFFPNDRAYSMGLPALNFPINFWPKHSAAPRLLSQTLWWHRNQSPPGFRIFFKDLERKKPMGIFYTSWTTIQIFGAKTGFSMLASIPFWAKPGTTFLNGQPCVFSEELPMPVGWCVTCVGLNENSQRWMKTMKIWPEKTGQSLGRQCGLLSFFFANLVSGKLGVDPHLDDIYQPCYPIFDLGRQSSHAKNRLKPW